MNGGLYVFWVTVCVPLAIEFENIISGGKWIYLLIFEGGWVVAMFIVVFLSIIARRWINNFTRLKRFYYIAALILLFYGSKMIYSSVSAFILR